MNDWEKLRLSYAIALTKKVSLPKYVDMVRQLGMLYLRIDSIGWNWICKRPRLCREGSKSMLLKWSFRWYSWIFCRQIITVCSMSLAKLTMKTWATYIVFPVNSPRSTIYPAWRSYIKRMVDSCLQWRNLTWKNKRMENCREASWML